MAPRRSITEEETGRIGGYRVPQEYEDKWKEVLSFFYGQMTGKRAHMAVIDMLHAQITPIMRQQRAEEEQKRETFRSRINLDELQPIY